MEAENNKDQKQAASPFPKMEEAVLQFWQDNQIFAKSVKKEAPQGSYIFNDGPPFITGLPHYATLLPSVAKDVVPRYWTMRGYRVERKWGWDCHGLPAENKVENQLGLKNKKDIEELGVGKFVDACRNYVKEGSDQWRWYIDRIGRWVDMDNAYRTMDLDFMESVMWAFKKLHDDGFVYEGYRTSLHCPRCATPLSKFEITMDAGSYRDITEPSVTVKFKVIGKENEYLLAWTTTPWTLPGNLALAVGKKIKYVKAKVEEEILILAKDRVEEILKNKDYKIIAEILGKDLVGETYESLYVLSSEKIKNNKNVYKVYGADFVTTEDGTGIVHIAPNFGEDDFELSKAIGLPMVDLMDENGIYAKEAGQWQNFYYKKAGDAVKEDLQKRNIIFSIFDVTHPYPFCYRCNTSLIYRTQKAWYLQIDKIREKLIESNKKINWVPEYFKEGRFQFNLESAPDWCLSRSRYWGSPIPVWRCQSCDKIKVVGSLKEIEELSGQKIDDLHRPGIDEVKFKCEQCDGSMERVSEVLDCWFESGSMPFAQWHYPFERETDFKNIFPADFIVEYTGQLRGWFYYLHVLSNALFDSLSYKNVIVTGVLAGTDGRKMSKSFGNYPDPRLVLEKYGSDALRMYFMSSSIMMGDDTSLSEKDIQDSLRKNIIILWNVYNFYAMYATESKVESYKVESKNILDQWILKRLDQLTGEVTENMDKYNLPKAARPISEFIDDLSTWYIRRSRDRFKGDDVDDKEAAIATTGYVLLQLSKVIAPFMPFIAEQLWQKITGNNFEDGNKSVHLEAWPAAHSIEHVTHNIIEEMGKTRKIVVLGLSGRDRIGEKIRQPLSELRIGEKYKIDDSYKELVKEELNIKKISSFKEDGEINEKDMSKWISIVGLSESSLFQTTDVMERIMLEKEITDELKLEGTKRDLVRSINNLRKDAGLTIQDRAVIYWQTDDKMTKEVFETMRGEIMKDTLSVDIKEGTDSDIDFKKDVKVNDSQIVLAIKKK